MLLSAGVDIKTALDIQVQQLTGKAGTLLASIRDSVVAGSTLSEAAQQSGEFSAYEFYSLQIGEETGRLVSILQELAHYYARQIKQRRQLIQALAYPVLVMATAVGAVVFMLNFIVPMFSDVFRRFGGQLPPLTQTIVGLSAFVRGHVWLGMLSATGLLAAWRLFWRVPGYRYRMSQALLRVPILGPIVLRVYLVRLCSSLSLLSSAHVPLVQALALARQMIGFAPLVRALETVEAQIMQGTALHTSLAAFSFFEPRFIALVKVGEEVNQLGHFFSLLAQQYSDEVDHRAALLSSTLEPLIIIFLGLVVGLILVAMYLPIFQMSSAIG
ncbi:type II secretion system F family protein [Hymenobacter lucidus]|nr:type II secretion system F family protein [Hymenobacter lucidus]